MALKPSLEIRSISRDLKSLTLRDVTGDYDASLNPGGYGSPNLARAAVTRVAYVLWNYERTFGLTLILNDITTPTAAQAVSGGDITISLYQGNTIKPICDGVLTLEVYVAGAEVPVTGVEGESQITGSLSGLLDATAVLVEDTLYLIDTSQPNSASTIYLQSPLLTDVTAARGSYGGFTRFLNIEGGKKCLVGKIGEFASCCNSVESVGDLMELWAYQLAAEQDFLDKNYSKANEMALSLAKYCKTFNCGCS